MYMYVQTNLRHCRCFHLCFCGGLSSFSTLMSTVCRALNIRW